MGGWFNGRLPGHGASNEVWASADGEKWDQVTAKAGWSPRLAAAVAFKGRMWIMGGLENYLLGGGNTGNKPFTISYPSLPATPHLFLGKGMNRAAGFGLGLGF